jgi:hypothetical protein
LALPELLRDLGLDLVAITLLAYVLYFRRHGRRDLLVGYVALNLALFSVTAALGSAGTFNLGFGFGLFAVLSIVRLRSDETTQGEIGYTMVALVLGLLNGLPGLVVEAKVLFTVLLLTAMFVVDHPLVARSDRHQRFRIVLDVVEPDPARLRRVLEDRLGGRVTDVRIEDVDLVRETMRIDVRLRRGRSDVGASADGPALP